MSIYRFKTKDKEARDKLADRLDAEGGNCARDECLKFVVEDEKSTSAAELDDEPDEKSYSELNDAKKVVYEVTWYTLDSDVMP